jgi:hypothetical protein
MNKSFKKNGFVIVKKAISEDLANFCFEYLKIKSNAVKYYYDKGIIDKNNDFFGVFDDGQVEKSFSHYADFAMETLLIKLKNKLEKEIGNKLIPTYSYTRLYYQGAILSRHKDRLSCELSTTLNLGGDSWPIYIDPTGEDNVYDQINKRYFKQNKSPKKGAHKGISVNLNPGDMLIYRGNIFEHWRNRFKGKICGQVFLHYNLLNGKAGISNIYDGREMLGLRYPAIQFSK